MLVIHWLTKVTDDPVVQGAGPINIIGIGSHEDCRNRMPCIDQVLVEFDPGTSGILTSAIRQAVSLTRWDARKSAAETKASTL
jgi:hypothetical protein